MQCICAVFDACCCWLLSCALLCRINSIGTELTRDDRKKLYSNFGLLYPHGHNELSIAEDFDQIRAAMEKVPAYANVFNKVRSTGCRPLCGAMGQGTAESSQNGKPVVSSLQGGFLQGVVMLARSLLVSFSGVRECRGVVCLLLTVWHSC